MKLLSREIRFTMKKFRPCPAALGQFEPSPTRRRDVVVAATATEHADVERERAFKVRDLEVDVTDVNTWIDW